MMTMKDVGEDNPARSTMRSSRRYVNAKVEVEARYDLAMTSLATKWCQ
jgi:hypothetical protein